MKLVFEITPLSQLRRLGKWGYYFGKGSTGEAEPAFFNLVDLTPFI